MTVGSARTCILKRIRKELAHIWVWAHVELGGQVGFFVCVYRDEVHGGAG